MQFRNMFFVILAIILASNAHCMNEGQKVIDKKRIVEVQVECLAFDESKKSIHLSVMDTIVNSVKQIFTELHDNEFPIYAAYGLSEQTKHNSSTVSMHAYGAAIDVNYLMNPRFDVPKHSFSPVRLENQEDDESNIRKDLADMKITAEEIEAVIYTVIQPKGSDDWFINRSITRKGMITPKIVSIFKENGFNIWGGMWKEPVDYMHFQMPKELAEQLAQESSGAARESIWESHLKMCNSKTKEI